MAREREFPTRVTTAVGDALPGLQFASSAPSAARQLDTPHSLQYRSTSASIRVILSHPRMVSGKPGLRIVAGNRSLLKAERLFRKGRTDCAD